MKKSDTLWPRLRKAGHMIVQDRVTTHVRYDVRIKVSEAIYRHDSGHYVDIVYNILCDAIYQEFRDGH